MLLRPRKALFKNNIKNRSNKTLKIFFKKKSTLLNFNKTRLVYGQYGFLNKNTHYLLFNKFLFKIKLFLKKTIRRSTITGRYLWFKVFPHIPVTKKVIGSRMGKGKGKSSNWAAKIPSKSIFIELRNVRLGRTYYYLRQINYKLPGSYAIISKFNKHTHTLIAYKHTQVQYNHFF